MAPDATISEPARIQKVLTILPYSQISKFPIHHRQPLFILSFPTTKERKAKQTVVALIHSWTSIYHTIFVSPTRHPTLLALSSSPADGYLTYLAIHTTPLYLKTPPPTTQEPTMQFSIFAFLSLLAVTALATPINIPRTTEVIGAREAQDGTPAMTDAAGNVVPFVSSGVQQSST